MFQGTSRGVRPRKQAARRQWHGRACGTFPAAIVALLLLAPAQTVAQERVSSPEAAQHVGRTVTVCGPVAGAAHFPRLKGGPTFLNFDRRHPEQTFTVVIWAADAVRFERPPHLLFAGKEVCVTGRIETFAGRPQIVVRDPARIAVVGPVFAGERFASSERLLLKALLAELGWGADPGDDVWDDAAAAALRAFQVEAGLPTDQERSPHALRALAEAVAALDAEARGRILELLLLNLAQREEAPSR